MYPSPQQKQSNQMTFMLKGYVVKLSMTALNLNITGEMEELLPSQSWNEGETTIRRSVKSILCYTSNMRGQYY